MVPARVRGRLVRPQTPHAGTASVEPRARSSVTAAAVGAGVGVGVGAGFLPGGVEDLEVLGAGQVAPEGFGGGEVGDGTSEGAGKYVAGVGGGTAPFGRLGDDAGSVVEPASGEPDVGVFGGGATVDDEDAAVDGEPLVLWTVRA